MAPLEKVQKMAGRSPRGRELVLRDTSKVKGEDWKHQEAAEDSQAPHVRSHFHCNDSTARTPGPHQESTLWQMAALKKLKAVSHHGAR